MIHRSYAHHGMSTHLLYPIWWAIRNRCEEPSATGWEHYGGRGIRLHPAWREDPRAFIEWIETNLGPRPSGTTAGGGRGEYTINRIRTSGHYEPGNLEWADWATQARTRGNDRMTTFAGWLAEQRKRDDAVGWFARYWRDLPSTPRLSSPSSIATHLEDREGHPGQDKAGGYLPYGFRDPQGGSHVRDAYDATLTEYRAVRAQIVQSASGVPAAAPEPPSGPENHAQEPPAAIIGRATDAGIAAAAQHAPPATQGINSTDIPMLTAIYRKLERIEAFLGLADAEDGVPELPWADWYAQADLSAAAE